VYASVEIMKVAHTGTQKVLVNFSELILSRRKLQERNLQ